MSRLLLLILVPILGFSWNFTKADYYSLNEKQLEVLEISQLVGEQKGYGRTLRVIAIIETIAGKLHRKKNNICGPHQVAVSSVKKRHPELEGTQKEICETIKDNPYVSAKLSLEEIMYWSKVYKGNKEKIVKAYNGGWDTTQHGDEYYSRFKKVDKVLKQIDTLR